MERHLATVYFGTLTRCLPACPVRTISFSLKTLPAMLAATFANSERLVGLCLQAEGNQF
jgi:hypothetical protein